MPLVAITRLRLRSWRHLPAFLLLAMRTSAQAQRAPGHLAMSLLPDARLTFWTRSVWQDKEAMRAYMGAGAHGTAMRRLAGWCDEASAVDWLQASTEPPDWQEAHRRMQGDGRPSRVERPTEAHLAHRIAPIRSTLGR